jgi:beta-N-acetylhexosaminidase
LMDLGANPFYLSADDKAWVKSTLGGMDTRAKAGQLFCPLGHTRDEAALKQLLGDIRPGAMLFRPAPGAIAHETHRVLQAHSAVPLLLAANLEAGGNGIATDGTLFCTQMQAAATGDPLHAYRLGLVCAREGAAVGANWAFAPVADVDLNFRNPITNTRTYGAGPDTVATMAKATIKAMRECCMAVAVKHFPGDGVDERDQHLLPSVNSLSQPQWDASFGMIYRELAKAGAQAVMAGHILLPAYQRALSPGIADRDMMPASLSPELLQGLLRGRLGFNGVIITDATTMTGFTQAMPREHAVPAAIAAGCDMFLFNIGLLGDYEHMIRGIERGAVTQERLNEAVSRILALKASLGLHRKKASGTLVQGREALAVLNCAEHRDWAAQCADQSVTLVKDTQGLLPISPAQHRRILIHVLGDEPRADAEILHECFRDLLRAEGFEVTVFDRGSFDPASMRKPPREQVEGCDLVLYYASIGPESNQTALRIDWRVPGGTVAPKFIHEKPMLLVSVGSPYHLLDAPRIKTMVNAYTSSREVLNALVEKLTGRSQFFGVSPVDPFCGCWDARL